MFEDPLTNRFREIASFFIRPNPHGYPASELFQGRPCHTRMIFEDPSRRRWRVVVASFVAICVLGLGVLVSFGAAFVTSPQLQGISATTTTVFFGAASNNVKATDIVSRPKTDAQWLTPHAQEDARLVSAANIASGALPLFTTPSSTLRTAFLLQEDTNSVQSFEQNATSVDGVFPDWYFLSHTNCTLDARVDPSVTAAIRKTPAALFARVTDGEGATSYASETHSVLQNANTRDCLAQQLAKDAAARHADGLLVDIETLSESDQQNYLAFLISLQESLRKQHLHLIVAIPAGNQLYDPTAISSIADAVLVIMHGEHFASGTPGPLASQAWFEEALTHFAGVIPKNKLIIGMGSYGMDWTVPTSSAITKMPRTVAQGLTYEEALLLASRVGATPALSPLAKNTAFSYVDEQKNAHVVWMLDAVTAWNEWQDIRQANVLGVGLWRLGSEDPNIWTFLGNARSSSTALTTVPALSGEHSDPHAEIFHLASNPTPGKITFTRSADGMITNAAYTTMPTGYVLTRVGTVPPARSVVFAIYGLNQTWTPPLLDLLQANQLHAIFFVSETEARQNPGLLQEVARRGFQIGNLGYDQTNLTTLTPGQLRGHINSTQRYIESAMGHHSLLFSAPAPTTASQANVLKTAQEMGYLIISPNVHPLINAQTSPTASVQDILAQLALPEHHIIAFNEQGDGSIVQVLKPLIPALRTNGNSPLRFEQVIGVTAAALEPTYGFGETLIVGATSFMGQLKTHVWPVITWLFLITLGFTIIRILFMVVFALRSTHHKRKGTYHHPEDITPSILIPAYNEAETIGKTLRSVQASTHQLYEVLVIDDGSTDATAQIVSEFAAHDPRIRLIKKPNGGKATALNLGMREATHPIVITIDADTVLMPQAIDELIKPFGDPRVTAVCGNVEVGNPHNVLTGFQMLEYITAQNFDRRAFEDVNAISVVPGATGAWRRHHVLAIGGYESDTLTEDADLTIRMLADHGHIVYAPEAKSRTEAPDNIRDLAKQRFRWSFGTFQCLRKHSNLFFKGSVGWIALPNIFIFQIIFPLLAPLGDIVLIVVLLRGQFLMAFYSYILLTLLEAVGSFFAFFLERKSNRSILFILFIQRFFYRQFLYITIFRAIFAILRGKPNGWNKLQRTGTVAFAEVALPETVAI